MHKSLHATGVTSDRVSWVLDNVWPETASLVAASFKPGDQLICPGVVGAWPARYAWPIAGEHPASLATVRRHWAMRRVAKTDGATRQLAYLGHDRSLARRLARAIDYRARHLVVAQSWLPYLDEAGALGGRTFDVVMSRYPFGEVHRLLDQAAVEIGQSPTIADFRAPAALVRREAELLARARTVYTPHRGIAALFPDQVVQLAWHVPPAASHRAGKRIAFLGPTIARQRPDIAAKLAADCPEPLVVFGALIEPLWEGVRVEQRAIGPGWLDDIGAILHPAVLTHEPRALLQARVSGVTVYASPTCGLAAGDYLPLDRFLSC